MGPPARGKRASDHFASPRLGVRTLSGNATLQIGVTGDQWRCRSCSHFPRGTTNSGIMTEYLRAGCDGSRRQREADAKRCCGRAGRESPRTADEQSTRRHSSLCNSSRVNCLWWAQSGATPWERKPSRTKQLGHKGCLGRRKHGRECAVIGLVSATCRNQVCEA
jgi:hypothetical protein